MLATCSDNHYIYTECCSADPWVTEAMSLLVGSENSPLPIVVMLLDWHPNSPAISDSG